MKIPAAGKRVFKGKIFEVYQWEQKMYDDTIATFEMLKRPDTVQVIPTFGAKVCLAHEEQPGYARKLSFLGGRCEEGEDPLTSAKRELLEESGLVSDDWELFQSYEPLYKIEWQIHYFLARNCRKIQAPHLDAGEKIIVQEFSFPEFVQAVTAPSFGFNHFSYDLLRIKNDPVALQKLQRRLYDKMEA